MNRWRLACLGIVLLVLGGLAVAFTVVHDGLLHDVLIASALVAAVVLCRGVIPELDRTWLARWHERKAK